jgi:hypothetical protein
MKSLRWMMAGAIPTACGSAAWAQTAKPVERRTSAQALEILFKIVEKHIVSAGEAMPADKYAFAPVDGEFKGVRTFGQQLKHLAATNYILGAAALREKAPADPGDEMGPENVRTKAEIMEYVKGSFAYLRKAMQAIDDKNEVVPSDPISPLQHGTATRLGLVVESLLHAYDHYGQMVEYLRMNGLVPPASKP